MGLGHRAIRLSVASATAVITSLVVVATPAGAFTPVSGYTVSTPPTPTQVNTAVANAVDYIACQQAIDGSFNDDVPETAGAIISFGVLANNNITNLPTSIVDPDCPSPAQNFQADLTNAVSWLLGQQDTTDPTATGDYGGSWSYLASYQTYSTGLALAALSYSSTVPTTPTDAVTTAIANGRSFLENEFQAPPFETCTTTPSDPTSGYCGGFNYEADPDRSDESNTGYAMTGLELTGGVPTAIQSVDVGWQNNDQEDTTTNPTYAGTRNDGGAGYMPAFADFVSDFGSNANDTGTNLFSYGDDAVPSSDGRVQASLQLATDVLDTYEKAAHSVITPENLAVYHTGSSEDGSCDPSAGGCDWAFSFIGEGGYHYSLFALSKGLGSYIAPNLSDGTNWYAKIADLLVNQQDTTAGPSFGSWPANGRDDFTDLFATELSVFALGLVGVAAAPTPTLNDVIQVETSPSYAGDTVVISSSQLQSSCGGTISFETLQKGSPASPTVTKNSISVVLDDDGNATVVVGGNDCAPGSDVIDASMIEAPYLTDLTTLVVDPPVTTTAGVTGYPANEVETGNSPASGESDVYTVFYVETSPTYAEQPVEISSPELADRCLKGTRWESNGSGSPFINSATASATLDDDGNATFVFKGASCAAGDSTVIADVEAGTHPTYTSTYTIVAPEVTLATTMKTSVAATKHHRHHHGSGGSGSGTGGSPQPITVTASPDPLIAVGG